VSECDIVEFEKFVWGESCVGIDCMCETVAQVSRGVDVKEASSNERPG
jgi:hypothetical protein